jgi:Ca2+-binding RTX toxin-like protein
MRKLITLAVLAGLAVFVIAAYAGIASANHSEACGNDGPNGSGLIVGTDGPECLRGGNANDQVYGLGSHDRLGGNHGKDEVYGGTGDDRLFGGRGPDLLDGGPGFDVCGSKGRGDNDRFVDCERVIT